MNRGSGREDKGGKGNQGKDVKEEGKGKGEGMEGRESIGDGGEQSRCNEGMDSGKGRKEETNEE